MRSRTRALLVIVLSVATVLFYWIGAAALALVVLRQGNKEAFLIWLWAMLPALGAAWMGEIAPAVVLTTMLVSATVLKLTANWALSLIAVVLISVLSVGLIHLVEPPWLTVLELQIQQMIVDLNHRLNDPSVALAVPGRNQILSLLSLFSAIVAILCLMGGRALHAALDNPGGFRQEYYAMRCSKNLASLLLLVAIGLLASSKGNIVWAYLSGLPLLVAGMGFVHGQLAARTKSGLLVFVLYVFVILVSPAKEVLIALGFLDSWMNLRQRIAVSSKK